MKRIAIFGGTFNPIHFGHLAAAEAVCEKLKLEKVIFVPSYLPPHKSARNVVAAKDRYQMVCSAIKDNSCFECSDIEVRKAVRSYSINTVRHFQQRYGREAKIFFIIGQDSLFELSTWKDIDLILEMVTFVVVNRPGVPVRNISAEIKVRSVMMPNLEISSLFIRKAIRVGKSVNYLLPQGVLQYIKKKKLYL